MTGPPPVPERPGYKRISPRELADAVRGAAREEDGLQYPRSVQIILGEIGATLNWGTAENVADCLPREFGAEMRRRSFESSLARFSPVAFIARSAEREGVEGPLAAAHIRAVLRALDATLPWVLAEGVREEMARIRAAVERPAATPPAGG